MIKATLGGHLGRRRRRRTPSRRSSRACRRAGAPREPASPRPSPRAGSRRSSRVHDVDVGADDAAAPTLSFALGVTETSGREVFTIALTAQINIDPARRSYDAETRAALVELFGDARALGARPRKSFLWAQVSTLVPSFTGRDDVHAARPVHVRPRARRGQVPLQPARRRGAAQLPLHRLGAATAATTASCRSCSSRGRARRDWRMPVATWREMMERHYPNGAWVRAARRHASRALSRRRRAQRAAVLDACVAELLRGRLSVNAALEELLGTLLFEGYALYPYTPGATKNATPTPFGIVYPPAYAQATSEHVRQAAHAGRRARRRRRGADRRGALPAGRAARGHQAVRAGSTRPGARSPTWPRRRTSSRSSIGGLARPRADVGRATSATGRWRVMLCVHNTTPVARGPATAPSALAAQPALHAPGPAASTAGASSRRCEAPEARERQHLPGARHRGRRRAARRGDHAARPPALAPESRGDLFDGTEIEEALLLHVLALSDDEREAIAAADPAVREMVARAAAATPEDILALHGRTTLPSPIPDAAARRAARASSEVEVDGVTYRLGDKVVAAPRATAPTPTTRSSTAGSRRSSASTSTTRTSSTSASPSTTTPARS